MGQHCLCRRPTYYCDLVMDFPHSPHNICHKSHDLISSSEGRLMLGQPRRSSNSFVCRRVHTRTYCMRVCRTLISLYVLFVSVDEKHSYRMSRRRVCCAHGGWVGVIVQHPFTEHPRHQQRHHHQHHAQRQQDNHHYHQC